MVGRGDNVHNLLLRRRPRLLTLLRSLLLVHLSLLVSYLGRLLALRGSSIVAILLIGEGPFCEGFLHHPTRPRTRRAAPPRLPLVDRRLPRLLRSATLSIYLCQDLFVQRRAYLFYQFDCLQSSISHRLYFIEFAVIQNLKDLYSERHHLFLEDGRHRVNSINGNLLGAPLFAGNEAEEHW